MSTLDELRQRIQDKLAVTEERRLEVQDDLRQQMAAMERGQQRFSKIAACLVQEVIRPRIETLVSSFENAEMIEYQGTEQGHRCGCRFRPTSRYPAKVRFDLAVTYDDQADQALVLYHLDIDPSHSYFKEQDQVGFPLDEINHVQLGRWIDDLIVGFVHSYLLIEYSEPYHTGNLVIDPVCGMVINKNHAAAQGDYQGKPHYFCVEECKEKFLADPERYLSASRETHARR